MTKMTYPYRVRLPDGRWLANGKRISSNWYEIDLSHDKRRARRYKDYESARLDASLAKIKSRGGNYQVISQLKRSSQ